MAFVRVTKDNVKDVVDALNIADYCNGHIPAYNTRCPMYVGSKWRGVSFDGHECRDSCKIIDLFSENEHKRHNLCPAYRISRLLHGHTPELYVCASVFDREVEDICAVS